LRNPSSTSISAMSGEKNYRSTVRISLASPEEAQIIRSVLEVDEELQPQRLSRSFDIEGSQLVV
jgi:hypothetical protein